ncbi:hypothetical protein, partial [Vibrio parahaemolyticus]|uniref:hypothetical protein n=1 Tax=Vibrio parahaemolyticus TaxID=670 RepID=UPI0021128276
FFVVLTIFLYGVFVWLIYILILIVKAETIVLAVFIFFFLWGLENLIVILIISFNKAGVGERGLFYTLDDLF